MIKQIVFGFLLCFLIKGANAETSIDNHLNPAQSDSDADAQSLQQLALQKESLNDLLAEIEQRYGETAALLKKLHAEIEHKRAELEKLRSALNELKNQIGQQNKELAGQIRSAYAMGQQEKLKLILNQQDAGLSSRMMVYYGYLNKARVAKLAEINRSVKRLDQLENQNRQEAAALQKKREQKKAEQVILDDARKQRNELLAQINDHSSSSAEQLNHLLESENKLKGLIASLQNPEDDSDAEQSQEADYSTEPSQDEDPGIAVESSPELVESKDSFPKTKVDFSSLKGKLSWPVRGRLVQKFGSPRSDSVWDGVLIDAKEGTDIRAVNWGKIVYAEWLRGYGLLIIIDHGQGYMTLYAFNQSLYKHAGDTVNAGDIIASVGQSGGRSQAGLYFGIRKKGAPVDPVDWCGK